MLGVVFAALAVWFLVYTGQIVRSRQADVATFTQIYAEVQRGLTGREPGAEIQALVHLQDAILEMGVPIVVTTGADRRYVSSANLPFKVADPPAPDDLERIARYTEQLDAVNAPVGDTVNQLVHYGITPQAARLRIIPLLWTAGLALTALMTVSLVRYQRRAAAETAWMSVTRELAHQLGTPTSSLKGWVEVLAMPRSERPEQLSNLQVSSFIEEDVRLLEQVSHRFELIGRDTRLSPVSLNDVIQRLRRYLEGRIPRLGSGLALHFDIEERLPPVQGHAVLLAWALENLVKNALDAVASTGGAITISARRAAEDWVVLAVQDTGPGISPDVRDRIFEPGVTTKPGGWGVGLALTRRIIEGMHRGRIAVNDAPPRGVTFEVRLPATDNPRAPSSKPAHA